MRDVCERIEGMVQGEWRPCDPINVAKHVSFRKEKQYSRQNYLQAPLNSYQRTPAVVLYGIYLVLEYEHVIKIHPKKNLRLEQINVFFTSNRTQLGRLSILAAACGF